MNPDDERARRLLAHIFAPETRWSRLSSRLLAFGRRGVPDDRESRNPIKWVAAELGCQLQEARTRRINRAYDRSLR